MKISKISGTIIIDGISGWVSAKTAGICTGYGTLSDPYVIEDLVINSESSGTCLQIRHSNVYFRVENCTLYNSGEGFKVSGIKLQSVSNGILNNNKLHENNYGIIVNYGYNINITGNTVKDNVVDGIYLQFSDCNNVSNNIVSNNIYGIHLDRSDNNTIKYNYIINNEVGILLYAGSCNQILLNTYSGNAEDIRDNQEECSPESPPDWPTVSPFPIEIVIISMIFIVSTIVVGRLIVRRKSSRTAVREYKAQKEPVKQKLIVSDDIKDKVIKEAPQIETTKDAGPEELVVLSSPEERISKEKEDIQEIKVEDQDILEPLKIISKEPFSTPISSPKSTVEQTPLKEESSTRVIKEPIPPEVIKEIKKPIPVKIEPPQPRILSCAFCGMEVDAERNFCQQCGHELKKS